MIMLRRLCSHRSLTGLSVISTGSLLPCHKIQKRSCGDFHSPSGVLPHASARVLPGFVSEAEEESLVQECSKYVDHLDYQYDHWDGVIRGYRETEKSRWSPENSAVVERMRRAAFGNDVTIRPRVHVLDLSADGYIMPHVDSVKFCGDTIAGLSLLSDCVMRFKHEKEPEKMVDVFLPRLSLYVITGDARYLYTHEVLKAEESVFRGTPVQRGRRMSFICRQPVARPANQQTVLPNLNSAFDAENKPVYS
eukprot:scpid93335/ scgid32781/ Probable alpha-ketoglutarate-dependent dioxygenase ABH7; Alkylated DNA repair protein alkB homolog 7; Spermatogenesis cell proliferation-related protein; Spermatogenesis-associated protein 11